MNKVKTHLKSTVCVFKQQMPNKKSSQIVYTHNLCFTQKPFEVVFLDIHQAGDVWDVEAVVLHVVGL